MQVNKIESEVLKSIFEKNFIDTPCELEVIINDLTRSYFDFAQLITEIPDRDSLPPQDDLSRDLFTIRFLIDIFKDLIKAHQDTIKTTPETNKSRSGADQIPQQHSQTDKSK